MKNTRRDLLKIGIGTLQLALLERAGLFQSRKAVASTTRRPTKLLTIYAAGGWIPQFIFSPLRLGDVDRCIPTPQLSIGGAEPTFYRREHVETNLDGTPASDDTWAGRPLRMPRQWDESELSAGRRDRRVALGADLRTSPLCWAWPAYRLHENVSVVHGVDQGTAAHDSGAISMMCGIAGPTFASPGMHALVANAMLQRFPDRALPYAALGGPVSDRVALPPATGATNLTTAGSAALMLSERSREAWSGLQDRSPKSQLAYDGSAAPDVSTNRLEDFILARARQLHGRTNSTTDDFYQRIYDGYQNYSKTLARDVTSILEATPGFEHISAMGPDYPWWGDNGPLGYNLGTSVAASGGGVMGSMDLALKLLKSDLSSAVSLIVNPPSNGIYFDTHNDFTDHYPYLRATMEQIGRFIAELKLTPATSGGTLLDETLVLVMSEFGRTWNVTGGTDHWPATSVIFAGAGSSGSGWLNNNRMYGGYEVGTAQAPGSFMGETIDLIDEDGLGLQRPPQSRDIVYSVMDMLGIRQFLPGRPGKIVGLGA
ncbi:MAG: DUF1501 domain-containing protein [Myxococcota bacterium]